MFYKNIVINHKQHTIMFSELENSSKVSTKTSNVYHHESIVPVVSISSEESNEELVNEVWNWHVVSHYANKSKQGAKASLYNQFYAAIVSLPHVIHANKFFVFGKYSLAA